MSRDLPTMRIHPRDILVRHAENELREALADLVKKHALTEAEALRVVNAALSDWVAGVAKYAIRGERHGDPSKPGGIE